MNLSPTVNRLIQAQAHAMSDPRHTTLSLWRDGVGVLTRQRVLQMSA